MNRPEPPRVGFPPPKPPPRPTEGSAATATTREFVRGSSLLLFGRIVSVLLNLAVQVLTVRHLAVAEYGAFAYALGVASIGSSMILLGLGKALPRFVPMYHERGETGRAFGTIVLAVGTVVGLGLAVVLLLHGLRGVIEGTLVTDPLSLSVLLILIALTPLHALDTLLQKLAAVFIGARAIFFRRHVVGPGLKLAAVLLVMLVAGDAHLLAYGYVIGGLIGVWLYVAILIRDWRQKGLLQYLRPKRLIVPVREIYTFSIPLVTADFPGLVRGSVAVLLLEYFHTTTAVAGYRAVLPIAGVNLVASEAFAFLFVPLASRMYARKQSEDISDLYWRTATWISVLSFPVFAVSVTMAEPLAVVLFGEEYAGSGTLLALLAVGHFVYASMGYNAKTLTVYGRVRFLVASDLLAAGFGIGLGFLLIPAYGPLGAAIAVTMLMIFQALFKHLGLWWTGTGVRLIDFRFVRVHCVIFVLLAGLIALQQVVSLSLYQGVALVGVISLLLLRLTHRFIGIHETFPELSRIPLVRWILG